MLVSRSFVAITSSIVISLSNPSHALALKIGDINVNVESFTLENFTLALPPTATASLLLAGAGIIGDELRHRDLVGRMSRIEAKIDKVLLSLQVINHKLDSVSAQIASMQSKLIHIEDQIANLALNELLGAVQVAQNHWDDWTADPKNRLGLIEQQYTILQNKLSTLVAQGHFDHFIPVHLATLLALDMAALLDIDTRTQVRVIQSVIAFLDSAVREPAAATPETLELSSTDPFPARLVKLKERMKSYGLRVSLEPPEVGPRCANTGFHYRLQNIPDNHLVFTVHRFENYALCVTREGGRRFSRAAGPWEVLAILTVGTTDAHDWNVTLERMFYHTPRIDACGPDRYLSCRRGNIPVVEQTNDRDMSLDDLALAWGVSDEQPLTIKGNELADTVTDPLSQMSYSKSATTAVQQAKQDLLAKLRALETTAE